MRILYILLALALAPPALADRVRYLLEPDASTVQFTYTLSGEQVRGQMPVRAAEIFIDFDQLSASAVSVTLDASRAKAGMVFATEALRSTSVLDTKRHPTLRFQSSRVSGSYSAAKLAGALTIKGVTKPTTLTGGVFRLAGSDPKDLNRLTIQMSGAVSRNAFGASGFPDIVGDQIQIAISAQIRKAD